MKRLLFTLLYLAMLTSCASHKNVIETIDVSALDDEELCNSYGDRSVQAAEMRAALISRKLLTVDELALVDTRQVAVGFSECAVLAAFHLDDVDKEEFKDAAGRVIGKNMTAECGKSHLPFCPRTRFEIRNGTLRSMVKAL